MNKRVNKKSSQSDKYFLNLAGEFAVASQLNRRQMLATVSYGASKSADILVVHPELARAICIEVKSTSSKRWIVGDRALLKPNKGRELVWVLVLFSDLFDAIDNTRFFILEQGEIRDKCLKRNAVYDASYRERHGKEYSGRGVHNLVLENILDCEGRWDKIKKLLDHV